MARRTGSHQSCAALKSEPFSLLRKPRRIRRSPISNAGILTQRFAYNRSTSNEHGRPPSHCLLSEQLAVMTPCERFARIREGKSDRMIFISKLRITSHARCITIVILSLFTCDNFMYGKSKIKGCPFLQKHRYWIKKSRNFATLQSDRSRILSLHIVLKDL